ncbi:glycosyl transferase family protein [Escherichia coli]|uniref:Glycosyl transferase family protein n=1 Tax=Escherichia coli TaxID=562 RepID=A0A376VH57_ECOLX|nr:glycosyl transferase family protein [Escherichia coli]
MHLKKLNGLVSEFSMGGVSTTNNMELCADAKKVQRQILHVPGFWQNYPGIYASVLPQRRKPYITKAEYKGKRCKI